MSPDGLKKYVERVGFGSMKAHEELLDQSNTRKLYSKLLYQTLDKEDLTDIQQEVLESI